MATRKTTAKPKDATKAAALNRAAIVDVSIAKTATAKDIHAVIDRVLGMRGCRACGLIGRIVIEDIVTQPINEVAKEIAGGAAGIKVRVTG
jgi:RNA-binding protein YhbY